MDENNTTSTNTTITASVTVKATTSLSLSLSSSSSTMPQPSQSYAAFLNSAYYRSLSADGRERFDYHHQLPGEPSHDAVVGILSLSIIVFVCSSLVLLATRYTSGGQSGTLVFLRSLLLSDMLMALYGVTKMAMLLFLHQLRVNFFLPDSLFFTASLASSSSLLSLNLDCFLKLARPYKYAQVEKHTVITVMLLVWNAAFVVGFLPLVGWNDEAYTFRFFSFYPWHFLVFNGLVVLICVIVCIVCMVSLKKFFTIPETDPSCFSTRTLEVRKYRHLHRTIVIESAMWLASYLPFFVYISLACRQCSLGDYRHSDSTIIYFLPIFLTKSLFSAALQAFRTFHVHTVMNKIITDISHMASPRKNNHNYSHRQKSNSVSTIAYTNPLSEQNEQHYLETLHENCHCHCHHHKQNHLHHQHHNHHHHHLNNQFSEQRHVHLDNDTDFLQTNYHPFSSRHTEGANNFFLDSENWTIHQRNSIHSEELLRDDDDDNTDDIAMMGIANLAFRPSIQLDSMQESTKL